MSSIRHALQADEEQWRTLKPTLRHVQLLRRQASVGTYLTLNRSSSDDPKSHETRASAGTRHRPGRAPRFEVDERQQEKNWTWRKRWDEVPITERTEGEKLIDRIIFLLERENVPPHLFQRQMKALRQYRQQQRRELDNAMDGVLEHLTMRQKAALVLMAWL